MAKFARRSKYGNIRTDGFASKKEARRAQELQLLEKAGEIQGLAFQPRLALVVADVKVAEYVGDFKYLEGSVEVIEDVKSPASRTPVYLLKKKLVKALYGIDIRET